MAERRAKASRYRKLSGAGGSRYQFFCDVSGALICVAGPVFANTPEHELEHAWESEGKKNFNMCHACGRWISDIAYNADVLECIECAPWENEPSYCSHCGTKARENEVFCSRCKNRLRYGKNAKEEKTGLTADLGSQHCYGDMADPYEFGFGIRRMQEAKVCEHCGNIENADRHTCSGCGEQLPAQTLFQIYRMQHRKCEHCDTVLASYMYYCPHCGTPLKSE